MSNRKIMIEVTQEEFEIINNGGLGSVSRNLDDVSTKTLIEEIMRRTNGKDISSHTLVDFVDPSKKWSVTDGSLVIDEDNEKIRFEYSIKRRN